jgi:hypothetical protein
VSSSPSNKSTLFSTIEVLLLDPKHLNYIFLETAKYSLNNRIPAKKGKTQKHTKKDSRRHLNHNNHQASSNQKQERKLNTRAVQS